MAAGRHPTRFAVAAQTAAAPDASAARQQQAPTGRETLAGAARTRGSLQSSSRCPLSRRPAQEVAAEVAPAGGPLPTPRAFAETLVRHQNSAQCRRLGRRCSRRSSHQWQQAVPAAQAVPVAVQRRRGPPPRRLQAAAAAVAAQAPYHPHLQQAVVVAVAAPHQTRHLQALAAVVVAAVRPHRRRRRLQLGPSCPWAAVAAARRPHRLHRQTAVVEEAARRRQQHPRHCRHPRQGAVVAAARRRCRQPARWRQAAVAVVPRRRGKTHGRWVAEAAPLLVHRRLGVAAVAAAAPRTQVPGPRGTAVTPGMGGRGTAARQEAPAVRTRFPQRP